MPEGLEEARLAELGRDDAVAALLAAGYPAVRLALDNCQNFLVDPDNRAAHMVASFDHAVYGRYDQVGVAWNFGDLATPLDRPPPLLGEHSDMFLTEIGFDAEARAALFAAEVVKAA